MWIPSTYIVGGVVSGGVVGVVLPWDVYKQLPGSNGRECDRVQV